MKHGELQDAALYFFMEDFQWESKETVSFRP